MLNQDKINEFNKILNSIDYSKNRVTVFADFLTLAAYSLAQPFYKSPEIEDRYLNVAKNYKSEQLNLFAKLLAIVVDALEEQAHDFLGNCFMSSDMGNEYRGQFFTPYHICLMMAKMQFINAKELIEKQGYVTISEPCSGAGGMIIAAREVFIQEGLNPSSQMFVEAIDIDDLCFKMSYIQFSLLGIPARVIRGNTLSLEFYETLYTPVYFLNRWHYKLNKKEEIKEKKPSPTVIIDNQRARELIQLSLF